MQTFLILFIAKILSRLSHILGNGGSALPGLWAERMDKNIITKLSNQIPEGVILITGTNGKTTTTKMIAYSLEKVGKRLVTNRTGSNLSRGIASTLIEKSNLLGKIKADIGLFEVDEAAFPAIASSINPRSVLILNLFRDQLDRYGELNLVADAIGQAIAGIKSDIFLNVDDPLVANLANYIKARSRIHFFGVEEYQQVKLRHDYASDSNMCLICGLPLCYKKNFYSHIGHWYCSKNHNQRPTPEIKLRQKKNKSAQPDNLEIEIDSKKYLINTNLLGLYNAYNTLAAMAILSVEGVDLNESAKNLNQVTAAFGRAEELDINNRRLYLFLIKNPSGFNQIIQTFLSKVDNIPLLIIINDNLADGRDVSWLFDVAFEDILAGQRTIVASGTRAYDLAARLKYAGINFKVEPKIKDAINQIILSTKANDKIYILPTYTAMLQARRLLSKQTNTENIWR